ncbi:MAG: GAF domain-containing protein [Bernardetiaceae bacterium]|nr:GAF domain-containing protein [Bernardetiaceae bacterium]
MNKDNIISYLHPKTLRGRVVLGFFVIAISVISVLGFYLVYMQKQVLSQYNYTVYNTVPTRFYCKVIENCITGSTNAMDNYLATDEESHRDERNAIWEECLNAMDSLSNYTNTWREASVTALVYDVRIKANRLRDKQNQVEEQHFRLRSNLSEESRSERSRQVGQVKVLVDDIKAVLDLIVNIQKEEINRTQMQIDQNIYLLYGTITPVILALLILLFVYVAYKINSRLSYRLAVLNHNLSEIKKGELPTVKEYENDEISDVLELSNDITEDLKELKNFAIEVGKKNFDTPFKAFEKEGELGQAFHYMRDSLKNIAEKDKKTNWAISGEAYFSNLLQENTKDLDVLCQKFVSALMQYVDANHAAIYILKESGSHQCLELKAWYAYDYQKIQEKTIDIGEGLVGEAYREKRKIHLQHVPENFIKVSSGLGESTPSSLLVLPIKSIDRVEGVLELASFKSLEPHQIEFIERVVASFASSVVSVKVGLRTQRLLQDAQTQAEQLRSQEEEMRQNMEELQATQEEMQRKQQELEAAKITLESNEAVLQQALAKAKQNEAENKKLLRDAQMREEQLRAQEEEMRQNMEELQATQEEMQRKQQEIQKAKQALEINEQILQKALQKSKKGEAENKKLLQEAQEQAEQLRAQEEEMRQNMEELQATQEELYRKQQAEEKKARQLAANEGILQKALERAREKDIENKKLLQEAQEQAEQLRAQEEEMRQNMEELQATQEELYRKQQAEEKKARQLAANEGILKKALERAREKDIENKKLLQEAQQQAEQLRAQEEEMRQNMEELQATQEELNRKQQAEEKKAKKLVANEVILKKALERASQKDIENRKLLQETQMQAEQLRAQEEEMRQNLEELQATQEAMQERQNEINKVKSRLEANEKILLKKIQQYKSKDELLKAKEQEVQQLKAELDKYKK